MAGETGGTTDRLLNKLQYAAANKAADITTATTSDLMFFADVSDDYEIKVGDGANVLEAAGITATAAELNLLDGSAASAAELNEFVLTLDIPAIGDEASYYVVSPYAGNIKTIYSVIDAAITTADATITAEIATVAVTDGAITITQSGSAAGDVDSATPTAANAVTAGQAIEFVVTGAGTDAVDCHLTIVMTRT